MLWIENIRELVVVPPGPVPGRLMNRVPRIADAAVLTDGSSIAWFGPRSERKAPREAQRIDAGGGAVIPALIDCHTHAVFAGSRCDEFVAKIQGKSYAQIASEGGGILRTVDSVRRETAESLASMALPRLQRMLRLGVATVELKTGYGLSVSDENKMLAAFGLLAQSVPMEIVPTWMAAHAVPREFADRADEYLDVILSADALTAMRSLPTACAPEFCDVFCEKGAFSLEQTRRVFRTARSFGMRLKMHADQLSNMGAVSLACAEGCVSVDHLEQVDDEGIEALSNSNVIPVVLPGCAYFMGVKQAPARKLIEADLPLAIATDCNPGSCMIESLPWIMNIACTQMRLTPMEVLVACTANAAAALSRQDRLGCIAIGSQADLVILDQPSVEHWMYEPGRNSVRTLIRKGATVIMTDRAEFESKMPEQDS